MMSGIDSKHLAKGSKLPELNPDRITIFNMRYCPYAQRAMLVALHKKLDFDTINIDLANKPEWHVQKHPMTQVPALQHGDLIIFESLVVAEYLDDKYPAIRLGPETPEQKALDAGLISMYASRVTPNFYKLYRAEEGPDRDAALTGLHDGLDYIEADLKKRGSPFFRGKTVGLIDYNLWPWMERIPGMELVKQKKLIDWKRFPLLTDWVQRMEADPTVMRYRVPDDINAKFVESFLSGKSRYDFLDEE